MLRTTTRLVTDLTVFVFVVLFMRDGGAQILADHLTEVQTWNLVLLTCAVSYLISISRGTRRLWTHTAPQRHQLIDKLRDYPHTTNNTTN